MNMKKHIQHISGTLSLALLLSSSSVYADTKQTEAVQSAQMNGAKLLKESYAYLGALKRYEFDATVTNKVNVDGQSIQDSRMVEVKVRRPDQFRIDSKGNHIDRSMYLSSGIFTMIDNNEKYYTSVKTGGGIDKTLDMINRKLGVVVPLSTLLHSDMAKFIHPKRVQYFGLRNVGDIKCHYIAFRQGHTTVHLWIQSVNAPLIRAAKIVTDAKNDKGTTDMVVTWDTKPHFSDSVFIFHAPKGASNISIKPAK